VDRSKNGCKRHILTDATGVPLVVQTTPANVPDQNQLESLLDALPTIRQQRGRPRRKPDAILGDRAYGTKEKIKMVESRRIESLLAERSDINHGSGLGTLRYVVERTLSCIGHFRRLKLCYERWGEHLQGFHDLAACLLTRTRWANRVLWF